jgi:hypothetical protein
MEAAWIAKTITGAAPGRSAAASGLGPRLTAARNWPATPPTASPGLVLATGRCSDVFACSVPRVEGKPDFFWLKDWRVRALAVLLRRPSEDAPDADDND